MSQQNQKRISVIGLGFTTKQIIINNVYIGKFKMLNPLWMICVEEDGFLKNVCRPSMIKPVLEMCDLNKDLEEPNMYECDCDEAEFRLNHGFYMLDNQVKSVVSETMRNMLSDLSYYDLCYFECKLLPALFKVHHDNYVHNVNNDEDYLWSMINKWLFCDRKKDSAKIDSAKKRKVEYLKNELIEMSKQFCLLGHLEASDILMNMYETKVYDIDTNTFQVRKKR